MATFAKSTFSHSSYAAFRPSYPRSLYDRILAYHQGPQDLLLDLGCGHGVVSRALASDFSRIIGSDPSPGMVAQAQALTPSASYANITFRSSAAEQLDFVADGSADAIVAGQAAHWFNYDRAFPEFARVLRPGGTIAFWTYADPTFIKHPRATAVLRQWAHDFDPEKLGPYWTQPGRSIAEGMYRDIKPENYSDLFEDVQRIVHEPSTGEPGVGKGDYVLYRKAKVGEWKDYIRTWSAYHGWQEAHPGAKKRKDGGEGDVIDRLFDEMAQVEGWEGEDIEVEVEWGTGLVLARRK